MPLPANAAQVITAVPLKHSILLIVPTVPGKRRYSDIDSFIVGPIRFSLAPQQAVAVI